jgi:hypothetical protein
LSHRARPKIIRILVPSCIRVSLVVFIITDVNPVLTHTIPGGNCVYGVTSLGDELFVGRNSMQEVQVFDALTFTLHRSLTVPGLGSSVYNGLAACGDNNCLYVSDHGASLVHRVELAGSNATVKWSVAKSPCGLSVTINGNIIVTCYGAHKLQEYTTRGTIVREVNLQPDITSPFHAILLSSGQFVVSQEGSINGVYLVGVDGRVVRSYGGSDGSGGQQLKHPAGLAVDRNGCVLVANYIINSKVFVMDATLTLARELPLAVDGGLQRPWCLWLEESHGRLYVGELKSGRVLVFDNVRDLERWLNTA